MSHTETTYEDVHSPSRYDNKVFVAESKNGIMVNTGISESHRVSVQGRFFVMIIKGKAHILQPVYICGKPDTAGYINLKEIGGKAKCIADITYKYPTRLFEKRFNKAIFKQLP